MKKSILEEARRFQKLAGLLKINESPDWTWTSTRTDQVPVKKSPDSDSRLWSSGTVKHRLKLLKNMLLGSAKSYFMRYESGKPFKTDLLNILTSTIEWMFLSKLKKWHNIVFSKEPFQEIQLMVDTIAGKLSKNPTPDEVWELWPEFRDMLHKMFRSYENLGN